MTSRGSPSALAALEGRASDARGNAADALRLVCLADVEPEPVAWLWRHRIVADGLTLLEGAPSVGKSSVVYDLLARLTRGRAFPDGAPGREACDVCIVGPEDTASRVLRPRIDAAGGDAGRVHLVERQPTPENPSGALALPRDVALVRAAVEKTGARVVYFDALADLLGSVETNSDSGVRGALTPLAMLAREAKVAVLATRHHGKAGHRDAMFAGIGSVAFTAIARCVLHVYADRASPGAAAPAAPALRRTLAVAKNNLAPLAPTLAFTLESSDADASPRVLWDGIDARSAADLQAEYRRDDVGRERDPLDGKIQSEAARWLRELLAAKPMKKADVLKAGRADGYPSRTLERAFRHLGGESTLEGFPACATWSLPGTPGSASSPSLASSAEMGVSGEAAASSTIERPWAGSATRHPSGEAGETGEGGGAGRRAETRERVLAMLQGTGRGLSQAQLAEPLGLTGATVRAGLGAREVDGDDLADTDGTVHGPIPNGGRNRDALRVLATFGDDGVA